MIYGLIWWPTSQCAALVLEGLALVTDFRIRCPTLVYILWHGADPSVPGLCKYGVCFMFLACENTNCAHLSFHFYAVGMSHLGCVYALKSILQLTTCDVRTPPGLILDYLASLGTWTTTLWMAAFHQNLVHYKILSTCKSLKQHSILCDHEALCADGSLSSASVCFGRWNHEQEPG
jgi:hypothetical protein